MVTHWGHKLRSIAAVLWPSFVVASIAMLIFFALIDPDQLQTAFAWHTDFSHTAIYSIGFFFFWGVAGTSSALTNWLIRTERRKHDFPSQGKE